MVSLAELKHVIKTSGSHSAEEKQILSVLAYIDEQLQRVSNERREQLTLSDFLAKHQVMSANGLSNYSSHLLQSQIQAVLGNKATNIQQPEESAHPFAHLASPSKPISQLIYDATQGSAPEAYAQGDLIQKEVYAEAMKSIELSKEMKNLKFSFENELLTEYAKSHVDDHKIQSIIGQYINTRVNDCLVRSEFASALKGKNKTLYIKLLKESIISELKL